MLCWNLKRIEKLTVERVTDAIRTLGAVFFQEITSQKKGCRTQVYDQANLTLDASVDDQPDQETILNAADDTLDDFIEEMVHEGDSDALLIADYEQAIAETLQEDAELATAYTAYQQAQHRLTESTRTEDFGQPGHSQGTPKAKAMGVTSPQEKGSHSIRLVAIDHCRNES